MMTQTFCFVSCIIFLCIKNVASYYYPFAQEAHESMDCVIHFAKKICSFICLKWLVPKSVENVQTSYIDSILIWAGFKEEPLLLEQENSYYFCTAILFTSCAILFTIYMMFKKDQQAEKQAIIPYLLEHIEDTDDDNDSLLDFGGSQVSLKSCVRCPFTCRACLSEMSESGDMK